MDWSEFGTWIGQAVILMIIIGVALFVGTAIWSGIKDGRDK